MNQDAFKSQSREPSVAVFVLRSIFRELANRWDDEQGILSSELSTVSAKLLPSLRRIAAHTSSGHHASLNEAVTELVQAFAKIGK